MTESSVIIPIAKIKLKRTKIFIDSPNIYKPKKDAIRLTGSAIAGTITAFKFPKKIPPKNQASNLSTKF